MELSEALSVTRADLTGAACIIVTTFQALRVDNTEGRKVYESNGALQHHFEATGARDLYLDEQGVYTYSLANVLHMHHPLVIMDEAHNAHGAELRHVRAFSSVGDCGDDRHSSAHPRPKEGTLRE